jgi:hypothetical protein
MLDRALSVQALRPRPSRANACARSSRATAPPVGPLPTGPTAAIQTETGELVAFALPHRANGRSWRIARSVNPHVLRQVSEADIGRQVVLVFKAAGRGRRSSHSALLAANALRPSNPGDSPSPSTPNTTNQERPTITIEDFVFSGGFEEAGFPPCFPWIYAPSGLLSTSSSSCPGRP